MNIEHHLHVVDNEDEVNRLIWSLTSRGFTLRWDRPYSKFLVKEEISYMIIDSDHANNAIHWACGCQFTHLIVKEKLTETGVEYLLSRFRPESKAGVLFILNWRLTEEISNIFFKEEYSGKMCRDALNKYDAVY